MEENTTLQQKEANKSSILIPCLLIVLQSIIYSIGDPLVKNVFRSVPVYSVLSVRYTLGVTLMCLIAGKRIWRGLKTSTLKPFLPTSICTSFAYLFANLALSLAEVTPVAFIRSLSTVMTPLLALLLFRAPYAKHHIPIQLSVLVGLYLLCGPGGMTGFGLGETFALLSALMMASSLVFSRNALSKGVDPVTMAAVQAACCGIVSITAAFTLEGGLHLENATPSTWLIILYLALAGTVGGHWLQNFALRKISARTVALLQCTYPVLAAVTSHFLLHESLSLTGAIGCVIILACVVAETTIKSD